MPLKLKQVLRQEVYRHILTYPTKSDYEITEMLNEQSWNISRTAVYHVRKKLLGAIEYTLAQKVAGQFLADFQMAGDYFKLQVERLEKLKDAEKTIYKKGKAGKMYTEQIPLEPKDIFAIEKQQTELWKNVIFLARQSEAVDVMRLMKNGIIPIPDNSS